MNKILIKLSIFALAAIAVSCSSTAGNNQTANTNANGKTAVTNNNANKTASAATPSAAKTDGADNSKTTVKTNAAEPDVFGYFFIKGKVPEFTDISEINMGGSGEYGAKANPPFYGLIRLKDKKTDFALLKPTISGKNISFKTKEVKGISYEFNGTLLRTDYSGGDSDSEEVVMKGTLNKMDGGSPVAEEDVEFTWSNGG